jgi:S-formylglutathione hydrolase FrmB
MRSMSRLSIVLALMGLTAWTAIAAPLTATGKPQDGLEFQVSLSPALQTGPVTGRLFVIASTLSTNIPGRMNSATNPQPFFGLDVSGWAPGTTRTLTQGHDTYGYPIDNLKSLPEGDYFVQAFFNVYTRFDRSDGSVVWLHMPCGDGQSFTSSPGNLFSSVASMHLDGKTSGTVEMTLDQRIAYPAGTSTFVEDAPSQTCQQGNFADTAHLKHIKVQSPLLSEFWGRPMYIGANVLLPLNYDQAGHETDRYPVVYDHGHWPAGGVLGFNEASTTGFSGYWKNPSTPQFIVVTIRHENPYYDDSYAVNSANLGPYGDAITEELIPYIDAHFRTHAARWARTLTGGSTGGWEALGQMVFYPDVFGGAWAVSPDPVDFRFHQIVNIYSDANAYFTDRQWVDTPRPSQRNVPGNTLLSMVEENHWELARGPGWRSGQQWAIWSAVYGPQGPDGYPADIWDQETGVIDHSVAMAWQPMDLRLHIVNNWATLGPKLTGRIHDYGGDDDSFFLNNSSELLETAMAALTNPPANADFQWVNNGGHGASPFSTQQILTMMYNAMIADAP